MSRGCIVSRRDSHRRAEAPRRNPRRREYPTMRACIRVRGREREREGGGITRRGTKVCVTTAGDAFVKFVIARGTIARRAGGYRRRRGRACACHERGCIYKFRIPVVPLRKRSIAIGKSRRRDVACRAIVNSGPTQRDGRGSNDFFSSAPSIAR